ncbi:phospho-N-acetylmuramoyl-pentapeptide-transferase [Candidatus Peregrinibacteria bacterium]|nr:phospho-N-acetylmuramoyl-pentapeptide-transferase [Candidatus Peregrinibacteria bacterium]
MSDTIRHLILILGSEFVAFVAALILTPPLIHLLKKYNIRKRIREEAMTGEKAKNYRQLHLHKEGTPTMGGIIIWGTTLATVALSRLLSALGIFDRSLLNRKETWLPLFTLAATALLGLIDDWLNIRSESKGIKVKPKFLWLIAFSLAGALWFYYKLGYNQIHIPFFGDTVIGWLYIPIFIFIIVASANAVNITDGLDGLAGGLLIIAFTSFGVIAYVKGLFILAALCGVISGALLAFVWFNIPPAKFYMGDTGALSLGATLGVIVMLTDSVLILPIIGFIFVIETLSVIIQVFSKKFFHRKVFSVAPLHHHFEHLGWSEATIVMRCWIIGGLFAALGLILALAGKF